MQRVNCRVWSQLISNKQICHNLYSNVSLFFLSNDRNSMKCTIYAQIAARIWN